MNEEASGGSQSIKKGRVKLDTWGSLPGRGLCFPGNSHKLPATVTSFYRMREIFGHGHGDRPHPKPRRTTNFVSESFKSTRRFIGFGKLNVSPKSKSLVGLS